MRRRSQPQHGFEGINATPLIDVVMCLIVFFLLVGKLAIDRQKGLRLPESTSGETARAADKLVISVYAPDRPGPPDWPARVEIEEKTISSRGELDSAVRSRLADRPGLEIEVRADRRLPYGAVEPVLKACATAGATDVRLATERSL